mmetsp:Transcript_623/g.1043  ORF Transcript_623/g.1043 Transcript_623/m.1043 type:complete len:113 (-) Transcript_623:14-352(-)
MARTKQTDRLAPSKGKKSPTASQVTRKNSSSSGGLKKPNRLTKSVPRRENAVRRESAAHQEIRRKHKQFAKSARGTALMEYYQTTTMTTATSFTTMTTTFTKTTKMITYTKA